MEQTKREKIMEYFKELRLGGFRRVYDEVLTRCAKANKGHESFSFGVIRVCIFSN